MASLLVLGFNPEKGGTVNGNLSATVGLKELPLVFSVNSTKKRKVTWININLISSGVTGEIFVKRTNPNGSVSETSRIPLSKYQTSDDFQANKATLPCEIFLDDGDEIILSTNNTDAATVEVGYAAEYSLI